MASKELTMRAALYEQVRQWVAHDPDPQTRAELQGLLREGDESELADRFDGPLEFGTAGIRCKLGGGPTRLNQAVVIQTTDGLARYLLEKVETARRQGVVIGYDARRMSEDLARQSARVLAGHRIGVHLFRDMVPTPLLAYAVLKLRAVAGIMITGSHNPKEYNGYKVYWGNGAQIIPPIDTGIAERIKTSPPADQVIRPELAELENDSHVNWLDQALADQYVEELLAGRLHPDTPCRDMKVVYTPLHGVGYALLKTILSKAGYEGVIPVPEQVDPDGEFPTTGFPNPEEIGTLALAQEVAITNNAELILANDPDADRLAVGVRASPGAYRFLKGDQIGVLLADYLMTERLALGRMPEKPLVQTTIVSSPRLLRQLAEAQGVHFEETLTGFKWIANRAMELEGEGYTFLFGYEEAIGYMVGQLVRDKDGLSAAMFVLEMAARYKSQGKTLIDRLTSIYRRFGLYHKHQMSFVFEGRQGHDRIANMLERLRASPPQTVAGFPVSCVSDYYAQQKKGPGEDQAAPISLPRSNVMAFDLKDGSRVIIRPSGTEPKLKFYLETIVPRDRIEDLEQGEAEAELKLGSLAEAVLALTGIEIDLQP